VYSTGTGTSLALNSLVVATDLTEPDKCGSCDAQDGMADCIPRGTLAEKEGMSRSLEHESFARLDQSTTGTLGSRQP
jgi:hypothetical protein